MQVWMMNSLPCSPVHMTERCSAKRLSRRTSQSTSKQSKGSSQKQSRLACIGRNCFDAWNTPFQTQNHIESGQTEEPIRTAGFRQAIMGMYHYTCAVCQLRILTLNGESITEAAHIIPFSESYNDDVRNGISLCKSHHWAFEKGLISLDKNYKVIVSEFILERGPTEWLLTTLRDKSILLPEHDVLYPAQEALAWHREEIFRE